MHTLKMIITEKHIRNRILFTLLMVALFQFGARVPLPGLHIEELNNNDLLTTVDLTTGGTLRQFGLFALGASPAITASLIVQVTTQLSPKLKKQAQTPKGQKQQNQIIRLGTLIFGIAMGFGIILLFDSFAYFGLTETLSWPLRILGSIVLGAMSVFVGYIGDLINQYGIGNGLSILIMSGIMTRIPTTIDSIVNDIELLEPSTMNLTIIAIVFVLLFIFTVQINSATYQVPLQSTLTTHKTDAHYLPIKVLASSVMPVIFTSVMIALFNFITETIGRPDIVINPTNTQGLIIQVIMIITFAYLYNWIQLNPEELTESLTRTGMYITNVPPANSKQYLTKLIMQITTVGAPALLIIVITPVILSHIFELPNIANLGGTSMLIIIGVFTDIHNQIKGLTKKYDYQSLFNESQVN